jgi:Peptidase A4 family
MRSHIPKRARRASVAAVLAAAAVAAQTTVASAASAVSSNWSGYAITGTTFKSVSGSWTQPAANCSSATASETASAFWVGLGGDNQSSNALEQTGTEADCTANRTARYLAWYELVPKASVRVSLAVRAGDRIAASVKVNGTKVTVTLKNKTTGKSFPKTLTMSSPDTTSAEWIAEAPAAVTPAGEEILPLTDFGTVRFTSATATSTAGHAGTAADAAWKATRIVLESSGGGHGPGPFGQFASDNTGATEATPTALAARGSAFSVRWSRAAAIPAAV